MPPQNKVVVGLYICIAAAKHCEMKQAAVVQMNEDGSSSWTSLVTAEWRLSRQQRLLQSGKKPPRYDGGGGAVEKNVKYRKQLLVHFITLLKI